MYKCYMIRTLCIAVKTQFLTPQGKLSLQGTFGVRKDVQVLSTHADEGEAEM